jgi:hypothetical protein
MHISARTPAMMPSPQAKEAPTKFTGKYKDVKHFLKCYNNLCATYNVEEDTEKCEHILEFFFFFNNLLCGAQLQSAANHTSKSTAYGYIRSRLEGKLLP